MVSIKEDKLMFEIRAKEWLGTGSFSIGVFFKNKENAEKKCEELNKLLHVYYVAPVIVQDEFE
jgi:hypothetical protein